MGGGIDHEPETPVAPTLNIHKRVFELSLGIVIWLDASSLPPQRRGFCVKADDQTLKALQTMETRYRDLVEQADDVIFSSTLDGILTSVNRAAEQLFGWPRDVLIGQSLGKFVTPASFALGTERLRRSLEGEKLPKLFEIEVVRRTGEIVPYEGWASFIYDDCGRPREVQGIFRDISERKRAAEALQASEERYRNLFEQSNDAMATFTLQGLFLSLNHAAEVLMDRSREELIGQPYYRFVPPDSVPILEERIRRALSGEQQAKIFEIEIVRKDGSIIPLECRTGLLYDNAGNPIGFEGTFRNITLRKQEEAALHQAKESAEAANLAKSQFLANMSHELRTPLNAIIGYSEMLSEEAEEYDLSTFTSDLTKIQIAARHLLILINEVLDLSKIEAGKMELHVESFDVETLLQEVITTMRPLVEANRNQLIVDSADNLGSMSADMVKVRQSLLNLLSNACKYTERGTITLESRRDIVEGVPWMTFRVSDTGIGIATEHLANIFEAFSQADSSTTRKYGGTGLGLAISRRFCRMMGGDITVESQPGRGATFCMRLPVMASLHTLD